MSNFNYDDDGEPIFMTNKEFNLSSKHYNNIRVYAEEDVKEFIKKVLDITLEDISCIAKKNKIKELAGDKLC